METRLVDLFVKRRKCRTEDGAFFERFFVIFEEGDGEMWVGRGSLMRASAVRQVQFNIVKI